MKPCPAKIGQRSGTAAVELAVCLPFMLLLILGIWEIGRMVQVQQLIANVTQIAIFVTPIFWPPEVLQSTSRAVFVTYNPLYHLIEIVRAPLIGKIPAWESYTFVFAFTVIGWAVTYLLFRHYRRRIAYWS